MNTLTKEWLLKTIAELEEERDAVPGIVNEDAAMSLAAMKLALASLEAEAGVNHQPVAWQYKEYVHVRGLGYLWREKLDCEFPGAECETLKDVVPLYTAPPAPVYVMDEKQSRELFENWCSVNIERNKWHPEYYAHYPATGQWRAWEACRTAMLQGAENAETPTTMQTAPALDSSPKIAESPTGINQGKSEPVTTANKLPFEQWLSQQTGTIDVECGCVMTEVFFHWLRVAYEAGNSPVIPDGWVACSERMPDIGTEIFYFCKDDGLRDCGIVSSSNFSGRGDAQLNVHAEGYDLRLGVDITHWMPLPAAPQQEVK